MASVACYQVEDVVVSQDVQIGNILVAKYGVNTSLVLMDFEPFITVYNSVIFFSSWIYVIYCHNLGLP